MLISGSGTNLAALIAACNNDELKNCSIVRVISSRKAAFGLERARAASIPTAVHSIFKYNQLHKDDPQSARLEYGRDLAALVLADSPDIVVCAGFMLVLSETFLKPLADAKVPIINLHPALPGQYNGANALERAHKDWMDGKILQTGVMIHAVIRDVDMGEPILVEEIDFIKGLDEDLEVFENRVHGREWKTIVKGTELAIEKWCRPAA